MLGLILWGPGCGPKLPKTYPVRGKVVMEDGDVGKLEGALIEFESVADKSVHAYGNLGADGSFSMSTQAAGAGLDGVVEGEHRVRIMLAVEENDDEDDRKGKKRRPAALHPRYHSFEKSKLTYTAPGEREVTFKVSRR
jgi:hypothetical protein